MNRLPRGQKRLSEVTLNNWLGLARSQEVAFREIPEAERDCFFFFF